MSENSPKLGEALNEAQSIIKAAEDRARDLTAQAEAAYQDGHDQGYEDGLEKGRIEAIHMAVRMLEDTGAIGDKLSAQAARLAMAIASSVIGEQIAVDPETVTRIASRALQEAIVIDTAIIVVHPEDQKILKKAQDELSRVAGGIGVSMEVDESMTRGGCVIRSDFGEVDARIENLIDVIESRLGLKRPAAQASTKNRK